jgi:hypothetical protein
MHKKKIAIEEHWRNKIVRRLRVRDVERGAIDDVWEEALNGDAELVWTDAYWKLPPKAEPKKKKVQKKKKKKQKRADILKNEAAFDG